MELTIHTLNSAPQETQASLQASVKADGIRAISNDTNAKTLGSARRETP
jgi:hypothetical protein